jgi:hypothetical protein
LHALGAALVDAVAQLSGNYMATSIDSVEVRVEALVINNQVRVEKRFPVRIDATGRVFEQGLSWSVVRSRESESPGPALGIVRPIRDRMETIDVSRPFTLPIVAIYHAQRNAKAEDVSLGSAAKEKVSRAGGYDSWLDALTDGSRLESWVIGKTLERLQRLSEGAEAISDDDELAVVNKAVSGCIPGAKGLRYDLRLRSLLLECEAGSPIPFFNLSDGQQGMISLVADIARRVCILNPHLGAQVLEETDGIIAVDELDIHLHPSWQGRILSILRSVFPRIQFFATSHSPQMVGGLHPSQVLILNNGKVERPQFTYGLDSSRILEDIMDSDSREPEIREIIGQLFLSVENGELAVAKKQLAKLREVAPGLPDYPHLDALIRRKETIGR